MQKGALHRLDFFRIGAEIEGEQTGSKGLDLRRPNIIGKAHLLTNANKKTRGEIAARFVDQLKSITVRVKNIGAAEPDDQDRLRFFALSFYHLVSVKYGDNGGVLKASSPGGRTPSFCSNN